MTARNGSNPTRKSPFLALLGIATTAVVLVAGAASAQTIWDGPALIFSKPDGADPTLPAFQDAIVPGVTLTRANTRGLYNIAAESFFLRGTSPIDTEWAWTFNNPALAESEIRASNFPALQFDEWTTAHAEQPLDTLGRPAVLHLITDDIYIDLTMTAWTTGPGGGFAYVRSTPPVPATVPTVGSLGQALGTIAFSIATGLALQRARPGSVRASLSAFGSRFARRRARSRLDTP